MRSMRNDILSMRIAFINQLLTQIILFWHAKMSYFVCGLKLMFG